MSTEPSTQVLLVEVRLHEPRFHGRPEWPPSPARLFQALVAAAAPRLGEPAIMAALRWLEEREAPVVAAPRHVAGQSVVLYVPNNDLDAAGGDPTQVASLRVPKIVAPRLLEPDVSFLYAWTFVDGEGDRSHARMITEIAEGLYQLGRGVDAGWARAKVVAPTALDEVLATFPGRVHRPGGTASSAALPCPRVGTLDSLNVRHAAQSRRFERRGTGRKSIEVFQQPPKALFQDVAYDCGPDRLLFDLQSPDDAGARARRPLEDVHDLVVATRDAAAARLRAALPDRIDDIDAVMIGARPGEPRRVPSALRVRIVPLPSIGHTQTDPSLRRVLVEVPQGGPLRRDDIRWAFSGLDLGFAVLTETDDRSMLDRYVSGAALNWRTITPVVLPAEAARRRIDPEHVMDEAKNAEERAREEAIAARSVAQALRHAEVSARVLSVSVQREPWSKKGQRAEPFAAGTRFAKERLWHVAIELDRPVGGPLVIGDGRYLGLGLLVPETSTVDRSSKAPVVFALRVLSGLEADADPEDVARALRRAVMARVQQVIGDRKSLPSVVSGHQSDGRPAKDHAHLFFQLDARRSRLLVFAPNAREARPAKLAQALENLTDLRAGRAGRIVLAADAFDAGDPLVASACAWTTVTPYTVRRHAKGVGALAAVEQDVRSACRDAGLPEPVEVTVRDVAASPGRALRGHVSLRFASAQQGPLLLGRSSHLGGGLFEAEG